MFSLLGTTFGGDGRTTFGLPDFRGRTPVHVGTGAGLSPYRWGQKSGQEDVTLLGTQIPSHSHTVSPQGTNNPSDPNDPTDAAAGTTSTRIDLYEQGGGDVTMQTVTTNNTGEGLSHNNMQPILTVNICIALTGLFPSRN